MTETSCPLVSEYTSASGWTVQPLTDSFGLDPFPRLSGVYSQDHVGSTLNCGLISHDRFKGALCWTALCDVTRTHIFTHVLTDIKQKLTSTYLSLICQVFLNSSERSD